MSMGSILAVPSASRRRSLGRRPRLARAIGAALIGLALTGCGGNDGHDDEPTGERPGGGTDAATTAPGGASPTPPASPAGRVALETTVAQLRETRVGLATVADLDLPAAYLERVADRMLRERHQNAAHAVNSDDPNAVTPFDPGPRPEPEAGRAFPVFAAPAPRVERERREELTEAWPASIGFRRDVPASLAALEGFGDDWPIGIAIDRDADAAVATAIAARLAREGLPRVTVEAIAALDLLGEPLPRAALAVRLRDLGLPVDLLEAFTVPADDDTVAAGARGVLAWIDWTRAGLAAGAGIDVLAERAPEAAFTWRPTVSGLRLMREDGTDRIGALRVQATRGDPWGPDGAGGTLDVVRSLATDAPDLDLLLSVEDRFAPELLPRLAGWRPASAATVRVHVEPLTVSQWAQDNGKGGLAPGRDGATEPVLLVPRFASRGEIGARFVPGDTYLAETLADARLRTATSPLHFQGGNLLPVVDPRDGGRLLLAADAEIHRNRALGLTAAQVETALAAETGCDRVLVLAPPAFHLDFAVSVRRVDDRSVAFVHDERAAVDLVLVVAARTLEAAGRLPAGTADAIAADLAAPPEEQRDRAVIDRLGPILYGMRRPDGMTDLAFVRFFDERAGDPGIGTFQRVLTAFELLMGRALEPEQVPGDALVQGYVASARRRIATAEAFTRALEDAGFEVVAVPGWSDQGRSLNTINMVQDRGRVFVPATGGRLAPVDEAAAAVLREHVGSGVELLAVPTAETQRRSGGVHCAVGPLPASPRPAGPAAPPTGDRGRRRPRVRKPRPTADPDRPRRIAPSAGASPRVAEAPASRAADLSDGSDPIRGKDGPPPPIRVTLRRAGSAHLELPFLPARGGKRPPRTSPPSPRGVKTR